ncbi:cytochrome P450 [Nocardia vaccinii]|uniref:cytochrome P450 n=1 Tax=Nocardia vaccinii TaxID=1822 RepID=UPI00082AE370|nr:cytochrome P450 [Nocardia vaccinii]
MAWLARGVVAVFEPDLVHRVMVETNEHYSIDSASLAGLRTRRRQMAALPFLMRTRRDLQRAFSQDLVAAHVQRSSRWMPVELGPTRTELVDICRTITGRCIADLCLGGDDSSQEIVEAIRDAAEGLFSNSLRAVDLSESRVRWWPRPFAGAASSANQRLVQLLTECVARRLDQPRPPAPRDLLDALLTSAELGAPPQDRIVPALRMALFASPGVPGVALSWLLLRMADCTEMRERVVDELSESLFGTVDSNRLTYTMAVVRETLRLHPPQWILSRTTTHSIELGGHRLPRGCEVILCPYLLHRDPRLWDDPEIFAPDRWLSGAVPHSRHAYLPFGSGTRVCPGSNLGTSAILAATHQLHTRFEFRLPSPETVPTKFSALLTPSQAIPECAERVHRA